MFANVSNEALPKRNTSQHQIIPISQRTTIIIKCAREGASLISKQGAVKKKMCICFNINTTGTSILKATFEFMLMKVT